MIVQYVTPSSGFLRTEPPLPQLGPYPFAISRERVTEEDAKMTFRESGTPAFELPQQNYRRRFFGLDSGTRHLFCAGLG